MDPKSLLDELMGKDRDKLPSERGKAIHFSDPQVCKHFLLGLCPHTLFVNTRSDLGPCEKLHDEEAKREFLALDEKERRRFRFEEEHLSFLQSLLKEVDRRLARAQSRLKLEQATPEAHQQAIRDRIEKINDRLKELEKTVEDLGEQGRLSEAQVAISSIEGLTKEKQMLENSQNAPPQEPISRMQLCEICGAFIVEGSEGDRTETHVAGKQHIGFDLIRKKIQSLKEAEEKYRKDRRRERSRSKSRERRRERDHHSERHDKKPHRDSGRDRDRSHRDHARRHRY
eukprot:GCRY01001771.1.p1 GENE.GCRY01001771.1~~GCRY01001771.1.p1  ORF type:complete len:285 (+),score=38.10 GCRY01001771.1:102-956(+)